jgi:hypothetical protein
MIACFTLRGLKAVGSLPRWQHESPVMVTPQTFPERNASHRVLEQLTFHRVQTIDHPEVGPVGEWKLGKDTDLQPRSRDSLHFRVCINTALES